MLFRTRSGIYEKICAFLTFRNAEYKDIAAGINYEKGGALTGYIDELIEAGYIRRTFSWDLKSNKKSTISLYRLTDNYLRFYYKFMQPKLTEIENDQYIDTDVSSLAGWYSVFGFQFENLLLNNRHLLKKIIRVESSQIVTDNPYYQRASKNRSGCQIEIGRAHV